MADEFLQQRHADENKHVRTTFLAGAPAAIAFALHETADRELSWSLLPMLFAVLSWGTSFACGIWASHHLQLALKANVGMNVAERRAWQDLHAEAKASFKTNVDKAWRQQNLQMWLLFAGAVLYLVGHTWAITEASLHDPRRPQSRAETAHTPPSR